MRRDMKPTVGNDCGLHTNISIMYTVKILVEVNNARMANITLRKARYEHKNHNYITNEYRFKQRMVFISERCKR